jgi:adenine-specific DNA-methyltransferase
MLCNEPTGDDPMNQQAELAIFNEIGIQNPDLLRTIADRANDHIERTDDEQLKEFSQFFTSPEIAAFIASRFSLDVMDSPRILDPGSGAGILGAALVQRLVSQGAKSVEVVFVEKEPAVREELATTVTLLKEEYGDAIKVDVVDRDFLELTPFDGYANFDYVISNPPYGKMSPKKPLGSDAPNAYARFMEVAAKLMRKGGQQCFIIPRSYASGYYFRKFRRRFHDLMDLESVHVFDSRRDAFKEQEVLQENVIVKYRIGVSPSDDVTISVSNGVEDLPNRDNLHIDRNLLFDAEDPAAMLHIPISDHDVALMESMGSWPTTLEDYGCEISTGPVVAFRARPDWIQEDDEGDTVPLLWMNHVSVGSVTWPLGDDFRKEEHLKADAPEKLTVPNETFVLLRRFSAREETRRLTAAVYHGGTFDGDIIGIENHLNFIHRDFHGLDDDEAEGIAGLLNSSLFDRYFRISAGNTQVNATQIRSLPLPPHDVTVKIGRALADKAADESIDDVISRFLDVG